MSAVRRRRDQALALAPAMVFVGIVVFLPSLRIVQLSLCRVSAEDGFEPHWSGLAQFVRLWQDGRWWTALLNTTLLTSSSVALEVAIGLAFALVLHRRFRGRGAVRAIAILPWSLPTAVMALAWSWIFNDSFGVANDVLRRLGLLTQPVAWLGSPGTAMLALVVADVWKTTPFVCLVLLAGLQSIPSEVVEAARIDGLSPLQRLRFVTLPLLAPSLIVAALFRTVHTFGAFDLPYVMTGGGPGGSTETVSLYAYRNFFRYLDFGYGSAISLQVALLIGAFAYLVTRLAGTRWSGG